MKLYYSWSARVFLFAMPLGPTLNRYVRASSQGSSKHSHTTHAQSRMPPSQGAQPPSFIQEITRIAFRVYPILRRLHRDIITKDDLVSPDSDPSHLDWWPFSTWDPRSDTIRSVILFYRLPPCLFFESPTCIGYKPVWSPMEWELQPLPVRWEDESISSIWRCGKTGWTTLPASNFSL